MPWFRAVNNVNRHMNVGIKKYLSQEDDYTVGFVTDLLLKESAVFGVREGAKHIRNIVRIDG